MYKKEMLTKIKYDKKGYFLQYIDIDNTFSGCIVFKNKRSIILINNSLSKIEKQFELHRLIKNRKLINSKFVL
jgi:hypothetical protein